MRSVCSRLTRTRRRNTPPVSRPSAIAGSTACCSTSHDVRRVAPQDGVDDHDVGLRARRPGSVSSVAVVARPDDGQPNGANASLSSRPTKKTGRRVDEDREQPQQHVGPRGRGGGRRSGRAGCRRAKATSSAQNDSSSVAAPLTTRMSETSRLSVSVVPKSPRRSARDVLPVLRQDRAGRGPRRPCARRSGRASDGRPSGGLIGSPITRISKNTIVTSTHSIGIDQRQSDQQVARERAERPAAAAGRLGRRAVSSGDEDVGGGHGVSPAVTWRARAPARAGRDRDPPTARVCVGASLRQRGEPELERRVERVVHALHVVAGHGDLRAGQQRQDRDLVGEPAPGSGRAWPRARPCRRRCARASSSVVICGSSS